MQARGTLFILLGIVQGIKALNGPKLVIEPPGSSISQPSGQGFVLTCRGLGASAKHFRNMKWMSPEGKPVKTTGTTRVTKEGNKIFLIFTTPSAENSGLYTCRAEVEHMNDPLKAQVYMNFFGDITWEDCPKRQGLTINTHATIRCSVSSSLPIEAMWFKDNMQLWPSEQYNLTDSNITIFNVTERDAGTYMVRILVTEAGTFYTRKIYVDVNIPPHIKDINKNVVALKGKEVKIRCLATGHPNPVYQWLDSSLKNLEDRPEYTVKGDEGLLVIHKAGKQHVGKYTCRAKNEAGVDEERVHLEVIAKPTILAFYNQSAPDHGRVQFECRANGDPIPKITIRKLGNPKPFLLGDNKVEFNNRIDDDSIVVIMSIPFLSRNDDGQYSCVAENKGGKQEKVASLTIEYAPTVSIDPGTHISTTKGNPVNVTCKADAVPDATITWWFHGHQIDENGPNYRIWDNISRSTLLVTPSLKFRKDTTNVFGTYTCLGRNPHGSSAVTFVLEEK